MVFVEAMAAVAIAVGGGENLNIFGIRKLERGSVFVLSCGGVSKKQRGIKK